VHDGAAGWPFLEEGSYQVVQDLLLLLDAGLEPQVSIDPYFTIDTVLHTSTLMQGNIHCSTAST
jgi:hypothetical protein